MKVSVQIIQRGKAFGTIDCTYVYGRYCGNDCQPGAWFAGWYTEDKTNAEGEYPLDCKDEAQAWLRERDLDP